MIGIQIGISMSSRRTHTPWSPSDETGLWIWGRSDDPGADVDTATDPDEFTSIPERGLVGGNDPESPTLSYAQTTSNLKPQVSGDWSVTPGMQFGGGGNNRRLVHSAPASAFPAAHAGDTDFYLAWVCRLSSLAATSTFFGTYSTVANSVGFVAQALSTGAFQYAIGNGTANSVASSSTGAVTTDATTIFEIQKLGTAMVVRANGTQIATGTLASPSASDPLSTLVVGARPNGNNGIVGWMPEWIGFVGTLPNPAIVRAYLERHVYTP